MIQIFIQIILSSFIFAGTPVDYQKQIDKHLSGFIIVPKAEFSSDLVKITKLENPGLAIGDFNGDKIPDFAALVRNKVKKRYEAGANSYDYYDGKFVICLGTKKSDFKCPMVSSPTIHLPLETYLQTVPPQRTGCYNEKGKKDFINVKTDAISMNFFEKAAVNYIHQPDGTYLSCTTAD